MSIEQAILGIISLYPCSGYDMKIELEKGGVSLFWAMTFGSIYPKLEQLEQAGLITIEQENTEGRPKKIHELTSKGWQTLSDWLAEPPAYPLPTRDELMLKLNFWGSGRPEDRATLVRHLQGRRAKSTELLKYLREWPSNGESLVSEYGMLLIDYARTRLEAELAWVETSIAQLEGTPTPPIQDPHGLAERQKVRRKAALKQAND